MRRTIFHRKCDPSMPTSTRSSASTTVEPIDQHQRRAVRLPRRSLVVVSGRERLKIAHPDERPSGLAHPRDVNRILHPPDVRLRERRAASGDLIQVASGDRIVARVKAMRHLLGAKDVDVGGQLVVQAAPQRFGRQRRGHVEVGDLARRVDARVGAAGAVELEVLPQGDGADGAIDLALHRPRILLDLPAAVPRPGVLDRQFEAGHRVIVSGRPGGRSPAMARSPSAPCGSP